MTTSKQLTLRFGEEKSMYSPVGFPASRSPMLEKGWGKKMTAIFGQSFTEQSERSGQGMSWGKMFVASLVGRMDWSSKRCTLTWKVKDTKSKRLYFQLSASMPHTEGIESTSLLKTPAAMDAYSENLSKKEQIFGNSGTLAQELATGFIYKRGILPTPNSYDWNTATKPETYLARSQRHKEKNVNLQMTLRQMTMFVPNKVDHPKLGAGSQLNPHFVAEMMGFPLNWTDLPFLTGENNP
jgi:hypothetical protein